MVLVVMPSVNQIHTELIALQIIDVLLDIGKTPRKPQYNMAPDLPLILRSCEFEDINFICSSGNFISCLYHPYNH